MMKRLVSMIMMAAVCVSLPGLLRAQVVNPIQAAIDAAAVGDVVRIAAGTYQGPVVLKDGITLVGAGADVTVIDGAGAEVVVEGAKNSALVGFTIRNGRVLAENNRAFLGVYRCKLSDFQVMAFRLTEGSALIEDVLIAGSGAGVGMATFGSNPYVVNSTITGCVAGILVHGNLSVTARNNAFCGLSRGIHLAVAGASVLSEGNLFDPSVQSPVLGGSMGEKDVVAVMDVARTFTYSPAPSAEELAQFLARMKTSYDEAIQEHPVVYYYLLGTLGEFRVVTLFPWATFTVAASAVDTEITDYTAYDVKTVEPLHAERVKSAPRPAVTVINAEKAELEFDRYALDNLYRHPASYFMDAQQRLVFDRATSFSRICVVLPEGYVPTNVNHPYTVETVNGRIVVTILDMGHTQIRMEMVAIPAAPQE